MGIGVLYVNKELVVSLNEMKKYEFLRKVLKDSWIIVPISGCQLIYKVWSYHKGTCA